MAADLLGSMRVEIVGDNTKLDKSIDTSKKKTDDYGKTITSLSKTMKKVFTGVAIFAVIKGIAKISSELINAASDAEETRNKFNVVFGEIPDAAQEAAARIKDEFKLADSTVENFLSGVGDITSGLGATGEEALLAAEKITKLALDIDSFANLSGGAEQAVKALTGLITGEREAVKALGIVINDNNLKQFAKDTGLVFKELTPLEKGFLSLDLAVSQSQLAIGDFARSQESFANQSKIAREAVKDLQVEIGEALLPTATTIIGTFGRLTGALADFIKERNNLNAAVEAEAAGNATIDQRIILLEKENAILELSVTRRENNLEAILKQGQVSEADIRITKEQIALVEQQIETNQRVIDALIIRDKTQLAIAQQERSDAAATALELAQQEEAESLLNDRILARRTSIEVEIDLIDKQIEKWVEFRDVIGVQELLNDLISERNDLLNEQTEPLDENTEATFRNLRAIEDYPTQLENAEFAHSKFTESVLEDNEEMSLSTTDMLDMSASLFDSFFSIVDTLTNSSLRNSLTAIDTLRDARLAAIDSDLAAALDAAGVSVETELERLEARLEAAKESGDAGNIAAAEDAITRLGIEAHFASAEQKILEDLAKEKRRLVHDAAVSAKVFGIIQAQISGFIGIAKALELPWPLNLVAAIATGAAATANTIAITAQPIPSFAQGGIIPGTPSKIDNMVANVASGELIANQDQKDRMLMQFLNGGGSGGGTTVINAVIDKKVLFKVILDGSRQGTAQFASRGVIN